MQSSQSSATVASNPGRSGERFWNLPNTITMLRMAVIPVLVGFPLYAGWAGSVVVAWLFILAAVGDLTALDPWLAGDFAEMLELGLLESFEDETIHSHFRLDGELNVHAEYGYLVNAATAQVVTDWWRQYSA